MISKYYGIKTNNLKDLNISFKANNIILFYGPSGSGKSSAAVDTIYKISEDEMNQLMNLKDCKSIYSLSDYENILPGICLQQENYNTNPRSTIATYFNLDSYFKEIFSATSNISQKHFQFNTKPGGCEICSGTGATLVPDLIKIVNYSLSISKIPFLTWKNTKADFYKKILLEYCENHDINTELPFKDLTNERQNELLYGVSEEKYKIKFKTNGRKHVKTSNYIGPINEIILQIENKNLPKNRIKYLTEGKCIGCNCSRFSKETLNYLVYGKNIGELYLMEFDQLFSWIVQNKNKWDKIPLEKRAFKKILSLLDCAIKLNLEYLNLNRSIPTLSGGELQRLRLAKALNSHFNNFLYVLDEPTSGLHPSEWKTVLDIIVKLKKKGNTVIIIEQNAILKKIADVKFKLGPGGGKNGGKLIRVSEGHCNFNLEYSFFETSRLVKIENASCNNVIGLNIEVPTKSIVGVCGASGSGKTSFLYGILPKFLNDATYLKQDPIRGNYYSIIATAIGIYRYIQELYSKQNKVSKEFFTFSSKGKGQCKKCSGKGFLKDDSIYINTELICPDCEGRRFSNAALKHKYMGKNIYEFLNTSIEELLCIIKYPNSKLYETMKFIESLGLGYLNLFQNVASLSGGEAQRVKLTKSIFYNPTKKNLLLDEPFRGVDESNIKKIMALFYSLVEKGYTIFIAEHSLLPLNYCSYIIEFGPKSGAYGGEVIFSGEKTKIGRSKKSIIAPYLQRMESIRY